LLHTRPPSARLARQQGRASPGLSPRGRRWRRPLAALGRPGGRAEGGRAERARAAALTPWRGPARPSGPWASPAASGPGARAPRRAPRGRARSVGPRRRRELSERASERASARQRDKDNPGGGGGGGGGGGQGGREAGRRGGRGAAAALEEEKRDTKNIFCGGREKTAPPFLLEQEKRAETRSHPEAPAGRRAARRPRGVNIHQGWGPNNGRAAGSGGDARPAPWVGPRARPARRSRERGRGGLGFPAGEVPGTRKRPCLAPTVTARTLTWTPKPRGRRTLAAPGERVCQLCPALKGLERGPDGGLPVHPPLSIRHPCPPRRAPWRPPFPVSLHEFLSFPG
jgi:hypothetical protein